MTREPRANRNYLFTSESVTEGHPDKMADTISDAVVDALLSQDPYARVACETLLTRGMVLVAGEVSTTGWADIRHLIRETVRDIGYVRAKFGFDAETCGVLVAIDEQSPDIFESVYRGDRDEVSELGAGDQGMMFGFACRETTTLMPMPIHLAHRIAQRLAEVRKKREVDYLRPDGKTQVTVEYVDGAPVRVDTVVVSAQHHEDVSRETMERDIIEKVIRPVVPAGMLDEKTRYLITPSARFVIGGPQADTGLTGRKVMVDTYGGYARHGGGALSGKDPTKVDRTGAYGARYVAKNIVAAGLADRCEVQVAYAIGVAEPVSLSLVTEGTAVVPEDRILEAVRQVFDLRPGALIRDLDLRRPIYKAVAAYGHFGREDLDLPWERTDRADELRRAAGLD
ncbi:MAG TPA: methionine adenosyltransferase [Clostridiales bacterium]|nr:methionine adenosyltransferase [Clostridiales bacterium]